LRVHIPSAIAAVNNRGDRGSARCRIGTPVFDGTRFNTIRQQC
jgi:hypothetical protein